MRPHRPDLFGLLLDRAAGNAHAAPHGGRPAALLHHGALESHRSTVSRASGARGGGKEEDGHFNLRGYQNPSLLCWCCVWISLFAGTFVNGCWFLFGTADVL